MITPKRVLFVAYQFPPAGGIGVHRVVKFIKYLPEFGWESSVLTVANPSVPLTDTSMGKDLPPSTLITKANTWEPGYRWKQKFSASAQGSAAKQAASSVSATANGTTGGTSGSSAKRWHPGRLVKQCLRQAANTCFQPDLQILWAPAALRAGRELLRRVPHDAIIATAPPFSSFYVGEQLARRSGLPLILDYRDEWGISNQHWENKQPNRFSDWLQSRMQRRILRQARAAIATTPSSCASITQTAHQAGATAECSYIYNGFDPADFAGAAATSARRDYGHGMNRFRLAYTGTLWNLNSIEPVVQALQRLAERNPYLAERLEFVVAGRRTAEQEAILDRLEALPCALVRLPFVSHQEAVELMQTADCLLLLNSKLQGAERIVNGKIFEYLAARRPFLLVSPKGDMWQLTQDCPLALPADPDDVPKITEYLAQELECHRLQMPRETGLWDPSIHERRHRAAELAGMLDRFTFATTGPRGQAANSSSAPRPGRSKLG